MRINAITYPSVEEQGLYVSESREVNAVGMGRTARKSESELAEAVRYVLDEHRKDPEVQLTGKQSGMFDMLKFGTDFRCRPDRTRAVPGHEAKLHIYCRTGCALKRPK